MLPLLILMSTYLYCNVGLEDTEFGTISPVFQVQYINEPVHIKCYSKGAKKWFFGMEPLDESLLKDQDVFIENASKKMIGVYQCTGTYENSKGFLKSSILLVAGRNK